MEISQLWQSVCDKLREQVNDVLFNVWIDPLVPYDLINGNEMIIIAPSQFHKDVIIDQHIGEKIEKSIFKTIGFDVKLRILVKGEDIPAETASPAEEISWHDAIDSYSNSQLVSDKQDGIPSGQMYSSSDDSFYEYTFDTFIVGPSNKFAHAASLAVAENPGGAYNPLFIYGDSGMGKTHLLFAIQNAVHKKFPEKKVMYVKGDQFTNELIEAIGKGRWTTCSSSAARCKHRKNSFIASIRFTRNINKSFSPATVLRERYRPWKTVCAHALKWDCWRILLLRNLKQESPSSNARPSNATWKSAMK